MSEINPCNSPLRRSGESVPSDEDIWSWTPHQREFTVTIHLRRVAANGSWVVGLASAIVDFATRVLGFTCARPPDVAVRPYERQP